MEHVVFFPAHDGSPAFRRVASLEDAVRLVEHLRNVEGVAEVSVHALAEVPLAFRPWYRVEVPAGQVADQVAEPAPSVQPDAVVEVPSVEVPSVEAPLQAVVVEEAPEQPVVALAASNGHQTDGPSSLGFFAS